jgi:hypothetical protein
VGFPLKDPAAWVVAKAVKKVDNSIVIMLLDTWYLIDTMRRQQNDNMVT